ncbi:MAG: lipocalin-like domain-containing protein [candidate division WOR-3 bacterium]|nr:MAG: lipocalin-like domain-containing protein [candidate division WOR-3 bacterium]
MEKGSKGVIGVWQVTEIRRQNVESPVVDKPFPNLFIFTPRHYSMVWVLGSSEPFAERWKPTDEEKIERFDSMVVNAGTYEIDGVTLTAHPMVARIPDFIGGKLICEFHIKNDTLRLKFVDEYSFDGVQAPWVAKGGLIITLVRIG